MKRHPTPPKQQRSLETQQRILGAVSDLLRERRFDEIPVQEIAARAGISVGGLYSRFASKEELIRWFDQQLLQVHQRAILRALDPERWEGAPLAAIIRRWVEIAIETFTGNRPLLREIALRSRGGDQEIRQRAQAFNESVDGALAVLILRSRHQIRAPDPEVAVRLGVIAVSATLREVLLFGEDAGRARALSGEELAEEMTRLFVGYLTHFPNDERETAR